MKPLFILLLACSTLACLAQDTVQVGYIPSGKDLNVPTPYNSQTWAGAVIYTLGLVAGGYMYRTYPDDSRREAGTLFIVSGGGGLAMMVGSRITARSRKKN